MITKLFVVVAEIMSDGDISNAREAVLKPSCELPEDTLKIRGYDFNQGVDLQAVMDSFITTGFQASSLGLAIQEINQMVRDISRCSEGYLTKSTFTVLLTHRTMVSVIVSYPNTTEVNGFSLVGHTVLNNPKGRIRTAGWLPRNHLIVWN